VESFTTGGSRDFQILAWHLALRSILHSVRYKSEALVASG